MQSLKLLIFCGLMGLSFLARAEEVGTAFTYQGELQRLGVPADGVFDFQFELFNIAVAGAPVAVTVQLEDVDVRSGLFSVELDFGAASIAGDQLWLAIAVREGVNDGAFTSLSPRYRLTAAPYALHAKSIAANAVGITEVDGTQIQLRIGSGCDPGTFIQAIASDGTVTCMDHNHSGAYLPVGATLTCGGIQKVTGLNSSGSVICGDDAVGSSDNLGNHIATSNIQLDGNWLSGDGGNEGIQIDTLGKVSVASAPGSANLQVGGVDGVLFHGALNSGSIPATGAGTRMMWYPGKAAFRAGYVEGNQWDSDDSVSGTLTVSAGSTIVTGSGTAFTTELKVGDTIGFDDYVGDGKLKVIASIEHNAQFTLTGALSSGYSGTASLIHIGIGSFAMGKNTQARGFYSTAMGWRTVASHWAATAMGAFTTASGDGASTAMGNGSEASGYSATAMGVGTQATGDLGATAMGRGTLASGDSGATAMGYGTLASGDNGATAMGHGTIAASDSETVVGKYNTEATDRLFAIGNGTLFARSDALVVKDNSDTGIGHSAPTTRLHVKDDIDGNGFFLSSYVGLFENAATGTTPDVLALKIGTTGNPGSGANFVAFFNGSDALLGEIDGNGGGGVAYKSTGGDYAEYLPQRDKSELLSAGDVVGVFAGQISHNTINAAQVMVITDRAAVIGNMPKGNEAKLLTHQTVAFIGQVPVKVRGIVRAGDVIITSGKNDGIGTAISMNALGQLDQVQIIGRAWEASDDPGLKKVMVAVGLDHTDMAISQVKKLQVAYKIQQQEMLSQRLEIAVLRTELADYRLLAADVQQIKNLLATQPQMIAKVSEGR